MCYNFSDFFFLKKTFISLIEANQAYFILNVIVENIYNEKSNTVITIKKIFKDNLCQVRGPQLSISVLRHFFLLLFLFNVTFHLTSPSNI